MDRPPVSLQYVDADGHGLDVRRWIWGNAVFCGLVSAYLFLSCFAWKPSDRAFGLGVRAGAAAVLAVAALSRIWALLYDRLHVGEDREFWVLHAARTRRRAVVGAACVLAVTVILMVAGGRAGSTVLVGFLIGPLFGALFVLAALGDTARSAAKAHRPGRRRD